MSTTRTPQLFVLVSKGRPQGSGSSTRRKQERINFYQSPSKPCNVTGFSKKNRWDPVVFQTALPFSEPQAEPDPKYRPMAAFWFPKNEQRSSQFGSTRPMACFFCPSPFRFVLVSRRGPLPNELRTGIHEDPIGCQCSRGALW